MTDSTPPAPTDHATRLGPVTLATPLVAASGTVGSVVDFAAVGAMEAYGAAVAKSVSDEPWSGRPAPRLAPTEAGMLNGIGIQNPGIAAWVEEVGRRIERVGVPVWGSAVGHTAQGYARVAEGLESAGVAAVEVNLSCPNLDRGRMFALDPEPAAEVVAAVRGATSRPIGAKLSPNADDVVAVATAVAAAGADWVVLTNTVWGMAIDVHDRRPVLSGAVGGYSGRAIKPISLRCVWEVAHALPGLPIVGCGGVATGFDVVEYLLAGANAVAIGTAHFAEPRAGRRILAEVDEYCLTHGVGRVADLVGAAEAWQ
jgi:dihydroorotate dehydrogenase (NAD+) catalytic subunit